MIAPLPARGWFNSMSRLSSQGSNSCLTHWIISAPRINDRLPGRSRRWLKFRWYLKFFNRRRVGADYKKVEEGCNDCQQKAAMKKHFNKSYIYIYICLLRCSDKMVQRFAQVHMYIHILEHTWGPIILFTPGFDIAEKTNLYSNLHRFEGKAGGGGTPAKNI